MQHNPYSPPESPVLGAAEPLGPRPISAWLLLILLALTGLALAFGTARTIYLVAPYYRQIPHQWNILLGIGLRLAILAAICGVLVGIFRRKKWGRWLGLLALVLLGASSILGNDTTAYDNEAQRTGGQLVQFVLMPVLLAWWVYAFGFSAKAKRYFRRQEPS